MKILCNKEELSVGVQVIQAALSPRSTLPILVNFLLETEAAQVKMASTDLEVGVKHLLRAEVVSGGAITVPAKKFGDILHSLSDSSTVDIQVEEGNKVLIRSGKSRFSLMGMPKADYPVLPEFSKKEAFAVPWKLLHEMIQKTLFAASNDETRHVLGGVFCVAEKGSLRMIATDGRRLALILRKGIPAHLNFKVTLPTKALQELVRLWGVTEEPSKEKKEDVSVCITENQAAFQFRETTLISRLIEGNFPNYEQVIPTKKETQATVSTKDLLSVTRRASLCTAERGGAVRYSFRPKTLHISASTQGLWEFEDEIDVDFTGSSFDVAFNPIFLIDFLKNSDSEKSVFSFTSPLNPALLQPAGDADNLCVIMPMRLQ